MQIFIQSVVEVKFLKANILQSTYITNILQSTYIKTSRSLICIHDAAKGEWGFLEEKSNDNDNDIERNQI